MSDCICDDCCDEVVPVAITNNSYSLTVADISVAVAAVVPADPTKRQVTITIDEAGYYDLRCRFVDTPTPSEAPSPSYPDEPGANEFLKTTLATGISTFEVENTGALQTWYLCVEFAGGVVISDAITIGV